jgi:cobalt-zinc-cadmium efflux system outer membrane protein
MRLVWRSCMVCALLASLAADAVAQTPLTWSDVLARLRAANPTLRAGAISVDEARTAETTGFLRPNPQLSVTDDQINLFGHPSDPWQNLITVASVSYLRERRGKRELRLESAKLGTAIAASAQADLQRTLTFGLRGAFVQLLQAKAFERLAIQNLSNYDQLLALSRVRMQAGDIAQIDLERLQLQRVQYESDLQVAHVNLRTAKIELLRLLNDPTPVDQFDVAGPFDFHPPAEGLDALRQQALSARPDLEAAVQAIDKASTDHRLAVANGSTDPTITVDAGLPRSPESYSPALDQYVGVSVSVPLRIFDRNQGEKTRTALEVARASQIADASRRQVLADVDAAYAALVSTVALLQPYKTTYLDQATRVRDTVTFSYENGGASLLDLLQAQQEYRSVQITYVNLVAAFLNAANQLDLAVGREVIP